MVDDVELILVGAKIGVNQGDQILIKLINIW
jgi:hypothetical protein